MSKTKLEGQNTHNNVLTKKGIKVFKRRNKVKVLIGASAGIVGIGAGIGVGYAVKPSTNIEPTPTPEPDVPVLPNEVTKIDLDLVWTADYYYDFEGQIRWNLTGVGKLGEDDITLIVEDYNKWYDTNTGEFMYRKPAFFNCMNNDETKSYLICTDDVVVNYIMYQFYLAIVGLDLDLMRKDLTNEERELDEIKRQQYQALINGEEGEFDGYYQQVYKLDDGVFEKIQQEMFEVYLEAQNENY